MPSHCIQMKYFFCWLLTTQTFQDWLNAIPECADLVVSYISLVIKNTNTIYQTISSTFVWKRQFFKKSKNNITRDAAKPVHFVWSSLYLQRVFLTVLPDFQYQNEKQVEINDIYFFKKFSMINSSSLAWQVFHHSWCWKVERSFF